MIAPAVGHLSYLSTKVPNVLDALCIPNSDRRSRLINAYAEFAVLPIWDDLPANVRWWHRRIDELVQSEQIDWTDRFGLTRRFKRIGWRKREEIASALITFCLVVWSEAGRSSGMAQNSGSPTAFDPSIALQEIL